MPGLSAIDQHEGHIGLAHFLAIDGTNAARLANLAATLGHLDIDHQGVSRADRTPPFHILGRHEVSEFPGVLGLTHHEDAGDLGDGLQLEDSGHDGMTREMALEVGLTHGDLFDGGDLVAFDARDAIHHEEGRPMGQHLHDLHDVEGGSIADECLGLGCRSWRRGGRGLGVGLGRARFGFGGGFFDGGLGRGSEGLGGLDRFPHLGEDGLGELGIGVVTGLDRDDVGVDGASDQGEVTDDIEHLVTHELLGIPEGFGGQDSVVADDDGIFEAAALDEAVFDEELDFLVEAEGPGMAEFLFPGSWGHLGGKMLGEPSTAIRAGARDAEAVVGKGGDDSIAEGQLDGGGQLVGFALLGLGDDAGVANDLGELPGAAVRDGGLVGVEFDDGVVDAGAGEGGEDVFDGVDFDGALGESRGALGINDMLGLGLDFGAAVEVGSAKA